MNLKQTIDQDLKQALLGGDKLKSETLRILKSVILNEEIAQNKRDVGLPDEEIISCLKKEVKKRQEASELYQKANEVARAKKELDEVKIINAYLPKAMSDEDVLMLVNQVVSEIGSDQKFMGKIISEVKALSKNSADGSQIARIVKETLR